MSQRFADINGDDFFKEGNVNEAVFHEPTVDRQLTDFDFFHGFDLNKKYLQGFTFRLNIPYLSSQVNGHVHPNGQQIFEANCQICHGQHDEGIDGKNLGNKMNFPHEAMFDVVQHGRFERSMPPWGIGNNDGFGGTLKKAEIDRIIDYVQSDEFRKNYKQSDQGAVLAGQLPKDVWFYLSRETVKNNGKVMVGQSEANPYIQK